MLGGRKEERARERRAWGGMIASVLYLISLMESLVNN